VPCPPRVAGANIIEVRLDHAEHQPPTRRKAPPDTFERGHNLAPGEYQQREERHDGVESAERVVEVRRVVST
jgi:hypothetical protein